MNLNEYFKLLRFDPKHHLGLGDIRLTMAQQEELEADNQRQAEEIEKYREALESANEMCRSAASIAERKGYETNWEAFRIKNYKSLELQQAALTKTEVKG